MMEEVTQRGIELVDAPSEVHVLKVTGTVDATNVRRLKKRLLAATYAASEAVVVDLREADLIDCTGVGALARFRWEIVKSGRVAVFVFPEGDVDASGTSAQMNLARRAAALA